MKETETWTYCIFLKFKIKKLYLFDFVYWHLLKLTRPKMLNISFDLKALEKFKKKK